MLKPIALSLGLVLASIATAHAQDVPAKVSDTALAVAKNHRVAFTLEGGRTVVGVPMAYDVQTVTVVEDTTRRIITVSRLDIVDVAMADAVQPQPQYAASVALAPPPPTRDRHVGLQLGSGPGNVFLDFDFGHFYGFIGTSIGYPIIFKGSSGGCDDGCNSQFFAFGVGAGGSWRLAPHSNWKFHLLGTLTPTWWGGFSAGIGIGAGFHYTSPNGFTAGFTIPVFGLAPGHNTVFTDLSSGPSLIGNYYVQSGMSLPLLSAGYRF